MEQKLLVIELWGLGDAVIMSSLLRSLPTGHYQITVLCKPASAALLRPSFPGVEFIEFTAPWTAFKGKYRLWSWPWRALFRLFDALRKTKFDVAISVRCDPRDAVVMWLAGARIRCGIPRAGGQLFINRPGGRMELSHRVEDWWRLCGLITNDEVKLNPPWLNGAEYHDATGSCWPNKNETSLWVIHCGAGQPIRRWPAEYLVSLVEELRKHYRFQLGIIIDADGAGEELEGIADMIYKPSSIRSLVQCLDESDLLIANDSGPGHIMAALSKPVISIFGSQRPEWFRPSGNRVQVVKLVPAPSPPLFDSGGEAERRCLLELTPDLAFKTIKPFLDKLSAGNSADRFDDPAAADTAPRI